jgi:lipopolysaccharide biosynthesis regulator YciM
MGLAKVLIAMDQPQKAEPLLEHAIQLDPTSAVAHFRLGTVYRQEGRTAEAKHELEEYQKYNHIKEKLRKIYHDLHQDEAVDENIDANPQK